MSARMHICDKGILAKVHKGGSFGLHPHPASDDVIFVLSGRGTAICDEEEEQLVAPGAAMSAQGFTTQHCQLWGCGISP